MICAKCHSENIKHRREMYRMTGWFFNHYDCQDCGVTDEVITDKLIIRKLKLKKIYDLQYLWE
jgi:hypothetical protein